MHEDTTFITKFFTHHDPKFGKFIYIKKVSVSVSLLGLLAKIKV